MVHVVLARKYRPRLWKEVIEQSAAVQSLQNAIKANRVGSAYVFFGPRGVGKTTIARILARAINCENPNGAEPCDACSSCQSILAGTALDIIEIDAATHRGIDNVRQLRENVKFRPMQGKKKVYIIDEVHMLTQESFNALLKTLEEPPDHVLFVLATTEFQKIPETILSRCQVFTFRKVALDIIQRYMARLLEQEKILYEENALFWVARRGDGSVRDSLSFLEQAVAFCGGSVTEEKVRELVGAMSSDLHLQILRALLLPDATSDDLIAPVHEMYNSGSDLNRFLWDFLDFLRVTVYIQRGVTGPTFLGIPGNEIARIKGEIAEIDPALLLYLFDQLYGLLDRVYALRPRNSYETRVLLEMELLHLREKCQRPSISGILQKLKKMGEDLAGAGGAPVASQEKRPSKAGRAAADPVTPASEVRPAEELPKEVELQKSFLGTFVDPGQIPDLNQAE